MASKQEKIRRMMGSFVGGSVSVATIAVVTSFQISLQATFLDLKVFQTAAHYELEIIETVVVENSSSDGETTSPPEPFPTRLWIENQWGDFEIGLTYGFNEGQISPLRENESYVLSIQYQSNLGWSTLASETIKTAPKLLANVDQLSFEGGYRDETIDLQLDITTQVGFRPVDRFEVSIVQGEQSWLQPVPVGRSSLRLEDLPHRNIPYDVSVLAWIQNQPEMIFSKQYLSIPFVHGTYERYFSAPRRLVVHPTQWSSTLTNETYTFELTSELETLTQDWNGRDAIVFENVAANQNVLLTWYVQYDDGNLPQKLMVHQEVIQSIAVPVFVISVSQDDARSVIQLTIDRTSDFTSLHLSRQDQSYPFELISENEVARYYEMSTDEDVRGVWELRGWLDEANPILYTLVVFQL